MTAATQQLAEVVQLPPDNFGCVFPCTTGVSCSSPQHGFPLDFPLLACRSLYLWELSQHDHTFEVSAVCIRHVSHSSGRHSERYPWGSGHVVIAFFCVLHSSNILVTIRPMSHPWPNGTVNISFIHQPNAYSSQ